MTINWNYLVKSGFILVATTLSLTACTRGRTQYQPQSQKPAPVVPKDLFSSFEQNELELKSQPEPQQVSRSGDEKSFEQREEQIRSNRLAPIVYGQGAGNISFTTTYQQSQSILSPEQGSTGLNQASSTSVYRREGMIIQWRQTGLRTPKLIILLPGYEGQLKLGLQLGSWQIGTKLGQLLPPGLDSSTVVQNRDVQNVLRQLYRELEKTSADCLDLQRCQIVASERQFSFKLPKVAIAVTYEAYTIRSIVLTDKVSVQGLSAPVDLVTGSFGTKIYLGQNFSQLEKELQLAGLQNISQPLIVSDLLIYELEGLSFNFSRSTQRELHALPDSQLLGIELETDYPKPILVGGKYLILESGPVDLSHFNQWQLKAVSVRDLQTIPEQALGTSLPKTMSERGIILFLHQLGDLLASEFKTLNPKAHPQVRLYGFNDDRLTRDLILVVTSLDQNQVTQKVSVLVNVENRRVSYNIRRFNGPFNQVFMQAAHQAMPEVHFKANESSNLGIQLGQKLLLEHVDEDEETATVVWQDSPIGKIRQLVDWRAANRRTSDLLSTKSRFEEPLLFLSGGGISERFANLEFLNFGSGVVLGVQATGGQSYKDSEVRRWVEVKFISFNGWAGQIKLANCGSKSSSQSELNLTVTAADEVIRQQLKQSPCSFVVDVDEKQSGRFDAIFFPQQLLKLNFSSRELVGLAIYSEDLAGGIK